MQAAFLYLQIGVNNPAPPIFSGLEANIWESVLETELLSYEDDTLEAQVSVARCGSMANPCPRELGRGWVPRAFHPPVPSRPPMLEPLSLPPVTSRGPVREDRNPVLQPVTIAVIMAAEGCGGGRGGLADQSCRRGDPVGPARACLGRPLFCTFA